jgi:hypothetical protein
MKLFRLVTGTLFLTLACLSPAAAQTTPPNLPPDGKLRLTGLAPSKLVSNLCLARYRISTTSPECQAFFDQGLGYYYSYVWMEAARSFETALLHDPDCPMAWWGLSRALESWNRGYLRRDPPSVMAAGPVLVLALKAIGRDDATTALLKADQLKDRASHREQQLILARMQQKGQAPGAGDGEARKRAAIATIDNLLALYDDDEEGWFFRAQLSGGQGGFGGVVSAVPFYKALLRINPLHPGANHELLHFYENYRRPALGWVYAENYIKSSPGIPHPFHMQAHLATRIGRWAKTSDRSAEAIRLERAYHKEMNVKPTEDHQYSHHLEILFVSLIHDGRFAEARAIEAEERAIEFKSWLTWFKLHLAERDWDGAAKIIDEYRREKNSDKALASYLAALLYLKQGDPLRAQPEVEVLQQVYQERKNDRQLEFRLWETQGLLLCQTGAADVGLKLLSRAVERSKNDYSHHAWGNGAYYMEAWGIAALQTGKEDVAEEAFLESLAHDPGSVRAALGMQVLCEHQGRTEEASRFADLARRCWKQAEPRSLEAELAALRSERHTSRTSGSSGK